VHAAWEYKVCSVIQRSRIQTLVQDILPGLLDPDLALAERRVEGALVVSAAFRYTRVLQCHEEGAMLIGAVFNIPSGYVRFPS
jgi:hypothetical protein